MVMNDWNIFLILFNTANIFFVLAFLAKKIVWLRLLTITGMAVSIPYYLFFKKHLCGITFSGFVSML